MPCFCPDFFPARGPSSPEASGDDSWIVKLSSGGTPVPPDYVLLGKYDGEALFEPRTAAEGVAELYPVDYGLVFAGATMWDPVGERRIYMAWLGGTTNAHCFPREITVEGDAIRFRPIREALDLRTPNASAEAAFSVEATNLTLAPLPTRGLQQLDLEAVFDVAEGSSWARWSSDANNCSFGLSVQGGLRISVSNRRDLANWTRLEQQFQNGAAESERHGVLTLDESGGPFVLPADGPLTLRVLVDHALVEAFADGRASVTTARFDSYDPNATEVALFSTCAGIDGRVRAWEMASAPVHGHL